MFGVYEIRNKEISRRIRVLSDQLGWVEKCGQGWFRLVERMYNERAYDKGLDGR